MNRAVDGDVVAIKVDIGSLFAHPATHSVFARSSLNPNGHQKQMRFSMKLKLTTAPSELTDLTLKMNLRTKNDRLKSLRKSTLTNQNRLDSPLEKSLALSNGIGDLLSRTSMRRLL